MHESFLLHRVDFRFDLGIQKFHRVGVIHQNFLPDPSEFYEHMIDVLYQKEQHLSVIQMCDELRW